MGNFDLLRELIIIYGSTTVISLIFNHFYHTRRAKKAFKESKRNLVYKDLSSETSTCLSELKESMKLSNKISMILSTIPLLQIVYTITNITRDPDFLKYYYNSHIEEINKLELETRKDMLAKIKKIKNVPNTIEERLKDKEYLPSEEDYREVLDFNNSDIIVRHKNLTIAKKRKDSK